jgi:hypothetical protein
MNRSFKLKFFEIFFSPMCAGGFGQGPWLEAHGGSTYCAVAALSLMGKLGKSPLPAAVFRIRGPGSEIRCLFDPWIRDPG